MSLVPYLSATKWHPIGPAAIHTPNVSLDYSSGRIECSAPDYTDPDVMYLASAGGGVWKTGDWTNTSQAPTWLPLSDDKPSLNFAGYRPLAVHPVDHQLVLGAVSGPGAGILKSSNGGLGWQLLANSQFEGATLGSLAVHPADPDILYLAVSSGGAGGGGVYKSVDGGVTWQNRTAFHMGRAADVIVARFDPQVLYAGLVGSNNQFSSDGVYRSTDAGASWQVMSGLPSTFFAGETGLGITARLDSAFAKGCVYAALFVVDKEGTLAVERYRTSDSGDSWTKLAPTPGKMEWRAWHLVLAVHPEKTEHVFVNDAYDLYESTDGGASWSAAESIGDDWTDVTFGPGNAAIATADRSAYRYELQTKQWLGRAGNLQLTQFYDITVDLQNPDRMYGIAQDHGDAVRFDGSIEWQYLPKGGNEHGKILVDPGNSDLLYVSDPLSFERLVQRSTDGGQSWTTILGIGLATLAGEEPADPFPLAKTTQKSFALDPSNPKRLLLGTLCVYETTDATSAQPNWTYSKALSSSEKTKERYITALAIAPSDSKTVYAATYDGHVWVSTKADVTAPWKQKDSGLYGTESIGAVVDIRVDPADPKQAFAVVGRSDRKNVWHLRHSGRLNDWVDVSGDLPKSLSATTIFVDWQYAVPALYVGTNRGVYHSVDLGTHWHKFGQFLPNTDVADLQHVPSLDILAAGTHGRGAWEILIPPSRVSGAVFDDADGDGMRGASEQGMAGVTVFLDTVDNDVPDRFDLATTTDERGAFAFAKVPPGTYAIRQVLPEGYRQTTAPRGPITLGGSDVRELHFGNRRDRAWTGPIYETIADLTHMAGRRRGEPLAPPDEFERPDSPRSS